MQIHRLLLDAGHGPNNEEPGEIDPGASYDGWTEHGIVAALTDALVALAPILGYAVLRAPEESRSAVVAWANGLYRPGDLFLSLHLNAFADVSATGAEVVYASNAPRERALNAFRAGTILAQTLGIPWRRVLLDIDTPNGRRRGRDGKPMGLTVLRRTRAPALLFEMGFITNATDCRAVRLRGVAAIAEAIEAVMTTREDSQ